MAFSDTWMALATVLRRVLYDVPITAVVDGAGKLPGALGPEVRFDFDGLAKARSPETKAIARAVEALAGRRSTVRPSDGAIMIRKDDLFVVAAALGISVDGLAHRLRAEGMLRNRTGRPSKPRSVRQQQP